MTTQQKTTPTYTGDHPTDAGQPPRDHPWKRLATTANIATVVVAVGVALAVRSVLPWPAAKFFVGLAVVAFVVGLAGVAYSRYVQTEPTVEETPAEVESQS